VRRATFSDKPTMSWLWLWRQVPSIFFSSRAQPEMAVVTRGYCSRSALLAILPRHPQRQGWMSSFLRGPGRCAQVLWRMATSCTTATQCVATGRVAHRASAQPGRGPFFPFAFQSALDPETAGPVVLPCCCCLDPEAWAIASAGELTLSSLQGVSFGPPRRG